MEDLIDSNPSFFTYTITEKTVNGFTLKFSGSIPTGNYSLAWTALESAREDTVIDGWTAIPNGATTITIPLSPSEVMDNYIVSLSIVNTDDTSVSNYNYIVIEKTIHEFTVLFSSAIDSPNYYLSWALPVSSTTFFNTYIYRQTGQMRGFDMDMSFDCTYGMDQVDITLEDVTNFMLIETGDFLLQENGDRIIL
jgi:hypothetical protein